MGYFVDELINTDKEKLRIKIDYLNKMTVLFLSLKGNISDIDIYRKVKTLQNLILMVDFI